VTIATVHVVSLNFLLIDTSCHLFDSALFERCKDEQRTLITTSYKLLLRKDCPPGAYLLNPQSTTQLELALTRLLRTHGVELSPCTFLTRCVVCNGNINRVETDEKKRAVFAEHGCPDLIESKENMEVFRCDGCNQGYWWDDRPSSSASRVFTQATKLLRLCLRGGVKIKDENTNNEAKRKEALGAFDFVDVERERQSNNANNLDRTDLSVIEWLRDEKLPNPFQLCSAYALSDGVNAKSSQQQTVTRESLPFSNVTLEFVGLLDYVFFDSCQFEQVGRLKVPTSFREMNASGKNKGHLIPSNIWPSDHLAVGARLRLKRDAIPQREEEKQTSNANTNATTLPVQMSHEPRCACGCVPNILSMMEMAALRKKAREEAMKMNEVN
jgi:uncharacterized protein with PIN domain